MAFMNGLNGRSEDHRYSNPRLSVEESSYSGLISPPRAQAQNSFYNSYQSNDARNGLQRRFTTDLAKMPGAPAFGNPPQMPSRQNSTSQAHAIEKVREAKRVAEEQLKLLDEQEKSLAQGASAHDFESITNRVNRISLHGPVSEPTTPPEYAGNGYLHRSRSSHISMNGITSPPGFGSRLSQTSSHITSPPSGRYSATDIYNQGQKQPAKSVPGSRRGSDEDEYYPAELPASRSQLGLNRYSMPVKSSRHNQRLSMGNNLTNSTFGPVNTASFLSLDEDDDKRLSGNVIDLTSARAQTYAQLGGLDEGFPTLRNDGFRLSANSAALDLAKSKTPDADAWASGSRFRPLHQSMPHTDSSMYRPDLSNLSSPPNDRASETSSMMSQRHSVGVSFSNDGVGQDRSSSNGSTSRPAALHPSYSTNDVPTVKSGIAADLLLTPPKTQAEQQFHNHNISLGRIPPNAVNNRQSREMSNGIASMMKNEDKQQLGVSSPSNLQANATPFGPNFTMADTSLMALTSPAASYNSPQQYAYSMQTYNVNSMAAHMAGNNSLQTYGGQQPVLYSQQFPAYSQYGKGQEVAARGGRRMHNGDEARFNNVPLESFRGNLFELCKDQHGCRYLQRKLEDGNADNIQAIFEETCPHIKDLMIDPFGNYLCQKLFEHCNDDQRTRLIEAAADGLSNIALNQHGTRALQKMIEHVNTDQQVQTIVRALTERVVELVQDLNGNHVIQKCLNRLGAEKSQFIYDAVGLHCVIVGTHRHGCCVLQRCIDHAVGYQRAQLIARITMCAFELVQDAFGNYVVQYILDLDEPQFTQPLCRSFCGNVPALSKQKFSSNVIEKCLRTADMPTKRNLIDEMLAGNELEKMLRDSFANYVVQTAMDYADHETKMKIIEHVRPILPHIKQTPHGRRIASKIMGQDTQSRITGSSNGHVAPSEAFSGPTFPSGRSGNTGGGRRQVQIVGGGFNTPRFTNGSFPTENGVENNFAQNAYNGMNGQGVEFESSPSLFNQQAYGPAGPTNGYSSFTNGQMGNNYF